MTDPSRRRVAILGTFDVENYGDLLFPLVARARLAPAGIDVVPVSPTDARTRYRDAMPALAQAAFDRDPGAFDGVLVGGGNIVHLLDFGLPGYGPLAYPALWAGTTAGAVRHGVPVLWNAPGVLVPATTAAPSDWIRRVADAASHFVVRDEESAAAMARWSGRRPGVVPDTALDLAMVWPREHLLRRHAEIRAELGMPGTGPVVALHVKARSLPAGDVASFAARLNEALTACGATAILLAIGRCHGDHDVVRALQAGSPAGRTFAFADTEMLEDIAAVIAGADAYLGASLHGQITAAACGVPARLVAMPALHKFAGQARLMGREDELVPDWAAALKDLAKVLAAPRRALPAAVHEALDGHWAEIRRQVGIGRGPARAPDVFGHGDPTAALAEAVAATTTRPPSPTAARQAGSAGAPDPAPSAAWDPALTERLIRDGALDEAATMIDAALARAPQQLQARLAQVRLAMARAETEHAIALASDLVGLRPETPWTWLSMVQALCRAERNSEAVTVFREALGKLGPEAPSLVSALNTLLPQLPAADQIALLKAALTASPEDSNLQIRLAMRAHASGDTALAIDMLGRAEQSGMALPAHAARLKSQLLPLTAGMAAATDQLREEVARGATDVETLCRLSRFAAAAGQFELARTALFQALESHPMEWRSLYRLNRLFLPERDEARILDRLDAMRAGSDPSAGWLLQYALFTLRTGQADTARAVLQRLAGDPVAGATAAGLSAALEATGLGAPRPGVVGDGHVRVVRQPGATATVLLFGGFLGGLSYMHDRYLDAVLARFPVHVIYLRDPYGRAYLQGIPELGPDEAAMRQALARVVAELGGQRLVTLGGSASGYAALRTGLALGADRVLSLAGFAAPGRAEVGDPAHGVQGLRELFPGDPAEHDLRPALKGQTRTRLTQVIGGAYRPDVLRARDLDGIASAELIVIPGVDTHHVALPAITDGTFGRLMESALTG